MARGNRMRIAALVVAAAAALAACSSSGGGNGKASSSPPAESTAPSSASSTAAAPTGSPIVIGTVGTFSGFAAATTIGAKYALQVWTKYVNANGGVDGHPVKLIVKDDGGSATKALAGVKQMVEQDKIVAIVGEHDSGLESAWTPYITSKHIPVIGGSATAQQWLTSPLFFPTATTALNTIGLTAYTTKLAGAKKYGLIYCAEVPACAQAGTLSQGIAKKLGIPFAGSVSISASSPNYTSQCLSLKNKGADMVFTATALDTSKRFIADCARQGYKPQYVDNPQNWSKDETKSATWDNSWLSGDTGLWTTNTPLVKTYKDQMSKAGRDYENASATAGWFAGELFKTAVEKSGASAVTSASILAGLYKLGPNFDLGGNIPPVTFTKGKPATQKPCGYFVQLKGGKATTPKGDGQVCLPG